MASKRTRSKRRSDTKSRSQLDPIFFLDRNLGSKIFPDLLRDADVRVEIHDNHFSKDEGDEKWLRTVGQRTWVVLTNDKAIRYKSVEAATSMGANVRMFVLPGNLKALDSANIFITALPRIKRFLEKHRNPFIARIHKNGDIRMRLSYEKWNRGAT